MRNCVILTADDRSVAADDRPVTADDGDISGHSYTRLPPAAETREVERNEILSIF